MNALQKIITAAAVSAAILSGACVGTFDVYAAKTAQSITLTQEAEVAPKCDKGGRALLADDDGTVYYMGTDKKGTFIYTLDSKQKVKLTYRIETASNSKLTVFNGSMKQIGDYLYLWYNEGSGSSIQTEKCVKLNKKLEAVAKYDYSNFAKEDQFIDTNGKKVCYVKNGKYLYICDMNGKNKKLLYTAGKDNNLYMIASIAMTDEYVGFVGQSGYGTTKYYCGIVDLKTGKTELKKQRKAEFPRAFGDTLVWYGGFGDDSSKGFSYYETSEIYTYKDGKYTVTKTEKGWEACYAHCCIDSEGRLITLEPLSGKAVVRVYENGKCQNKITVKTGSGFSGFAANGGTIAVSYVENTNDEKVKTKLISYGE